MSLSSSSELIFTSLQRRAMPMIRYRTKDITRLRRETCSCGRTFLKMDKVFGRTDKFYLKQYEEETNLVCNLLLDTSESMLYQSADAPMSKLEYAKSVAAALSRGRRGRRRGARWGRGRVSRTRSRGGSARRSGSSWGRRPARRRRRS